MIKKKNNNTCLIIFLLESASCTYLKSERIVICVHSYLGDRFSFIDKSKMAIWGWSYGGYTTGMVLARDVQNVFKCGLSVAPVTDWIYYGDGRILSLKGPAVVDLNIT